MPKKVIPVRFKPDNGSAYTTDIGTAIAANGRFILPPDIEETNVPAILAAVGASADSATANPIPCPDTVNADLRRLRFIRANGNSMSVPIGLQANLQTSAIAIRNILNAGGSQVVCIKLEGEYFPDLADELGLNYQNTIATSHVPTDAAKQYFHSGQIAYASDTGSTIIQSVKSISNKETAPADQIATAWTGCVGDFVKALPCPGRGRRNPLKHRRFELIFAVGATNPDGSVTVEDSESIELPVKSNVAADILSCGQSAAGLAGVYCIGYRGESYDRYHKLLS